MTPPNNAKGAPSSERLSEPNSQQEPDRTKPSVQRRRKRRYPKSYGSRYRPDENRTWWLVLYKCGRCGKYHRGTSPTEIVSGERRARCGRMTDLEIKRTYPAQGKAAGRA